MYRNMEPFWQHVILCSLSHFEMAQKWLFLGQSHYSRPCQSFQVGKDLSTWKLAPTLALKSIVFTQLMENLFELQKISMQIQNFYHVKIIFLELCELCAICSSNIVPLTCMENLVNLKGSFSVLTMLHQHQLRYLDSVRIWACSYATLNQLGSQALFSTNGSTSFLWDQPTLASPKMHWLIT